MKLKNKGKIIFICISLQYLEENVFLFDVL